MNTIFRKNSCDELLTRLDRLTPQCDRQWGKMSPAQAIEHCARAMDVALGRKVMKQALIGKLLSRFAWKKFMGEGPMPKNSPTGPTLIVKDEPDFEATRSRLCKCIAAMNEAGESAAEGRVHGF